MTSWYNTISQKRIPSSVEEKQRSFLFYSIVESLKKGTKRVMQKLQQQKNCILHNRFYIRNEGQYAKKSQQLCLTSWIVNFRSVRAVGKTCTCLLVWFRFRFFSLSSLCVHRCRRRCCRLRWIDQNTRDVLVGCIEGMEPNG